MSSPLDISQDVKHTLLVTIRHDIRAERRSRGWTQQQLAERVGLARQSIIALEKGRFDPTLETALRLAAVFDRTVDHLFQLEEE
ncbi:MAG: helix-turn-helix transcriptional regulator [Acidobacteriota bacterium]